MDLWFQSDAQFLKEMQPLIDPTTVAARAGEVDDIAPLVAFLCTDDSRWTIGSIISANGGLNLGDIVCGTIYLGKSNSLGEDLVRTLVL